MLIGHMPGERTKWVIGCMTGTSMDGLDMALVKITGEGLAMRAAIEHTASHPYGPLQRLMRPAANQRRYPAEQFAKLANMLAMLHVVHLKKFIQRTKAKVDFIVLHGQTIFHQRPMTWQLIDPMPVAHMLNLPVVYDLRGADVALGGHGAPITPLADYIFFRDPGETRCVVNLGGFINYTWLPRTKRTGADALKLIRGGDICACNQVLDYVARRRFRLPFDENGEQALQGRFNEGAAEMLRLMLGAQAEGGRSLGTGDEAMDWVKMFGGSVRGPDMARTACAVIAETLAGHIGETDRVIVAGGGSRNRCLMEELSSRVTNVGLTDDFGVPTAYREAAAMAVLGALSQDRVPITLKQVTGVDEPPVAGAWTW